MKITKFSGLWYFSAGFISYLLSEIINFEQQKGLSPSQAREGKIPNQKEVKDFVTHNELTLISNNLL